MKKSIVLMVLAALIVHVFLLSGLRFTAWPEMLSYPYLRNHDFLLYKDMIHPYPPVLTIALSIVYKFFGYKLIVLKIFTWLIILANDFLIFLITRKLTKKDIFAFLSLIFYIAIQPFLEGNQLWFDLAIVPSVLLSTYCILQRKYFWAGLALGVAILTKQTSGLFLVVSGLWLVIGERSFKKLLIFLTGPIILFLILVLRLITEGALAGFLNWTLIYPFTYWSHFPGYVQMVLTNREMVIIGLLLLPLVLLAVKLRKQLFKDPNLILFVSCVLISLILVYPRFSFFHFQIALAFIVILYGYFVRRFPLSKRSSPFYVAYFVLIALLIIKPAIKDWGKETRFWGKEEERMAEVIREKTKTNDLVYLLGPESGLYVLSGRLPPKPWTDNYVWYLEIPGIQEEIVKRWEENKPKVVFTNKAQKGNWYDLGTYRPQKIADWIKKEKIDQLVLSE